MNEKLIKILETLGMTRDEIEAKVKEITAGNPELEKASAVFLAWFSSVVGDALKPETALALALETWQELTGESPGYSPHHGGGA